MKSGGEGGVGSRKCSLWLSLQPVDSHFSTGKNSVKDPHNHKKGPRVDLFVFQLDTNAHFRGKSDRDMIEVTFSLRFLRLAWVFVPCWDQRILFCHDVRDSSLGSRTRNCIPLVALALVKA